jgi:hypothetical protein
VLGRGARLFEDATSVATATVLGFVGGYLLS